MTDLYQQAPGSKGYGPQDWEVVRRMAPGAMLLWVVPVEPAPIRWCLNHRKETWEGRTTCAGMGGVDLCNVIDALLIIGEETP